MKNTAKKIISILLMLVLALGVFNITPDNAYAADGDVVRIGFFKVDGFQYYDDNGNYAGYNIEYLNLIANYTGWKYEFVDVQTFDNGLTMLENKEIDLIAPVLMDAARLDRYDYSGFALGTGYYAIVSKADGNEYDYDDFGLLEGKSVSVPEGYPITEEFLKYMKLKGFEMEVVNYSSPNEAMSAMMKGDTDFSITSLMAVNEKYNVISKFCSSLMYYITWKGNYELIDELNRAMEYVENTYSGELESMEEMYFPSYGIQNYSKEEKEFIDSCPTIRLAYIQGRIPLSFRDDNGLSGISRSIFDRVSELTGLQFEYVPISYGKIDSTYFKNNKIDLISGVEYNSANLNVDSLHLSAPYISSRKVFVGRNDIQFSENEPFKVAVATGSATMPQVLSQKYPNFKIITYNTIEECFEAVRKGEADLLIHNQYSVDYMMSIPKYEDFTVVPTEGIEDELCFATMAYEGSELTEEEQLILISIIDKAIAEISSSEIDNIVVNDTLEYRYEFGFRDMLYKYRYLLVVAAISLVIIISILIYIILVNIKHNRKHSSEASLMRLQKKRYQIIVDKSDDMIYEISLERNSGVSSEKIKETFGWEIPSQVEDLTYDTLMRVLHVHPDDVDRLFEEYNKELTVKGIKSDKVLLGCVNGEYIWCEISLMPLYDVENNLISYVGRIKNIDENVKALQEQEQRLTETAIRNENLEELLSNAVMNNLTDVMKISTKNWKGFFYTIKDGKIIEKPLSAEWDDIFNVMLDGMVPEDRQRLVNIGKKSVLSKAEVGESFIYNYKSNYDIYNHRKTDKCFYYTTRFSIADINNEKSVIITNIDDTDVMAREQAYIEQKDEFLNVVIDSQRFLYNAIEDTYLITLVINLKTGIIHTFSGNENGIIEPHEIDITWNEFCENEMFPYMDAEDVKEFRKTASMRALAGLDINQNVKINFKAKLTADSLDPCDDENWFMLSFKVLENENEKLATAVIICDTDNVSEEVERYKTRQSLLSQLRINALIENNDEIIYDFNLIDGTCNITGNENNTLGWSVGRTIEKMSIEKMMNMWGVHPEDRFKIGEASQNIFKKNASIVRNVRVQKSDGSFVWAKISSVPIISEGRMISILCRLNRINVEKEEAALPETDMNTDKLTGLLNAKSLKDLTDKYLKEHSAKSDAFILIDLDHFKSFNDSMDYRMGDKVIKDTARKLQIIFSNYDYIGRFTGDEFGVFVKNIPLSTLEDKLDWALDKLKDSYSQGGKIMQVTASIGAAYSMVENAEYQELYHLADNAVYEAKKSGREKFVIKKYFS